MAKPADKIRLIVVRSGVVASVVIKVGTPLPDVRSKLDDLLLAVEYENKEFRRG